MLRRKVAAEGKCDGRGRIAGSSEDEKYWKIRQRLRKYKNDSEKTRV